MPIVERMLAKSPADRYESAATAAAELRSSRRFSTARAAATGAGTGA